ncbi:MAG: hypothetical protein AVDCRST_MAG30-1945 [uncultured Solirubrobacteraceae bacterium]|uniref:PKD domain-containing protein n=1 Tax=uncultured Solirubrobacteraceae bacterium TaxID=1162706 RepID=A0A6J4SPX3_9ACTN|nr:MAG: hypothetical protein AVDCRST_MAG30-1945 [uncultured Solirubrobacteraceae bacterium]
MPPIRPFLPRVAIALLTVLAVFTVGASAASADHVQPKPDISKLDYAPEGFFKAGSAVPGGNACAAEGALPFRAQMQGRRFNPSGKYNAFDNNVFEVFCLPYRGAGDKKADDVYGGGSGSDPGRGRCAPNPVPFPGPEAPLSTTAGRCPNHQLEYIDYYEETMRDILGDFGVEMKRYPFENPGSGNTTAGSAFNPAAVVPGTDHPDETIVIGAHYDQTTEGPSSVWDSAEGHAQVIRVAKLMADYWRATNTRPSATVKFIPWDGEESGTLGSLDYTENNIVPGEEEKVRGYWNTDPCAGGYPAYRYGNPNDRIGLGIQIARPAEIPGEFDVARVEAFNGAAPQIVEDVFDKIDDKVPTTAGDREVFISKAESPTNADMRPNGPVVIGDSRPVLFSSDWANFLAKGVPFFNPGPEITGPSDENEPNNPDGIAILHTPNDNMLTLNRMTSPEPSGERFSAGWMKGMEMCANLLAWGMLRPDQGGGQTTNDDVVAYYEALPNEAEATVPVNFDATGSYKYLTAGGRDLAPAEELEFSWDFGDGTTGTGRTVQHAYEKGGVYRSVLTVRHRASGKSDRMAVPITVVAPNLPGPELQKPAAEDPDGTFDLSWKFDEAIREGFKNYRVQEAPDASTPLNDPAEDIAAGWVASKPTESTIQPWQHSDSGSGSVRGNVKHEGARSFYTGVSRNNQQPGVGPNSGVSILELKEPVALARDAELQYRSSYANDVNDISRVEAAVVDGGEPQWQSVDSVTTTNFFNLPQDAALYPSGMELRRVDLGRFAGKKVRIRFVYALGASQFVNVARTGWYVDAIRLDTGTYQTIGEPTAKTFTVAGRPNGTYGYRVLGVYAGGLATSASNVETVRVTNSTVRPPGGGGGSGQGQGPGGGSDGPGTGCDPTAAFSSATVNALKKGRVRVAFARRSGSPATIDIFRTSVGRRVLKERLVARFTGRTSSFTWNGKANRKGRRVGDGTYIIRYRATNAAGRVDTRRRVVLRRKGRFIERPAYAGREGCGILDAFKLERPVFGGKRNRSLGISYRLTRAARVSVTVLRGSRVVKRFAPVQRPSGRTQRLRISARGLPRAEYRVRIEVLGAGGVTQTLVSRRL